MRSVRMDSDVALTMEGTAAGTPAYMPPEQAEGKIHLLDHRSDIYSLGAILYEILTLESPVEGRSVHEVLLKVADGKVVPPRKRAPTRHIPKELSAVAMKAMAKNRRKRYQSVQAFSQDIKLFLEGRSVSAAPDTFAQAFVKLIKRNKALSAAVAVAAIVLLTMGTVFTIDNTRKRLAAEDARDEAQSARKRERATALEASRELADQAARAAEEGRFDEAEIRADAAEKLASWGPWGSYARGAIAWERRELQTAEEHLEAAREKVKEDPTIRNLLVRVQAAIGKAREAAALLENLDNIEKWEDLLAAGDVLYGVEDYRRAQTLYEAALKKMKTDPTVTPERLTEAEDKFGNARAWVMCEGFQESIKDLAAKEQYERIAAKLAEIHDKGVTIGPVITDGLLCEVDLDANVRYLQPLKGMPLDKLWCNRSGVSDLGPLKGMPLKELNCQASRVSDLSPLQGMPLTKLYCDATVVRDLSPLKGMPLTTLYCSGTQVVDLSPLKGMPLTTLNCNQTQVTDLSSLTGMPLLKLDIVNCSLLRSLRPLEGLPLTSLRCDCTPVSDLSPLRGMQLTTLSCHLTKVSDLSLLKGMPLTTLICSQTQVTDLGPLKGMPLTELVCGLNSQLSDLSPIAGMALKTLHCAGTRIGDLSPLRGMPLEVLHCDNTQVSDLGPLRGMALSVLDCAGTRVTDLGPLEGAPLRLVTFTPKNITKGIDLLRQMGTVKSIGTHSHASRLRSPDVFWKKYDAGEFK